MEARNAAGRTISLLNDAPAPSTESMHHVSTAAHPGQSPTYYHTPPSAASSPDTPAMVRSSSYDSQTSNDVALSPLTPADYPFASSYQPNQYYQKKLPRLASRSNSYEDENSMLAQDRPAKRYPCRFRDSHGCEKTFTTSGHASRHSKIHTAEKAVHCTFPGCQKKFTRADNMKQHLETHYKDKSRGASQRKSLAQARRHSSSSSSARSRSSTTGGGDYMVQSRPELETVTQYDLPTPPVVSPGASGASGLGWDAHEHYRLPLPRRPASNGLDALAMIAAQESA